GLYLSNNFRSPPHVFQLAL
ncbi:hypothetical protein, conserved, partial [Babesia bigemina]